MKFRMLAAATSALVVAASIAMAACSSSPSGTTTGSEGTPVCTAADAGACPTGTGAMQLCVTGQGNQCTSAYMKVGSQTFMCNSCEDTTGCNQQASAACYGDAG